MNSPIKRSYRFVKATVGVSLLVMAFVITSLVINKVYAAPSTSHQGEHLITIHDRGSENVILTDASTISEALNKAGIALDEKDVVEPSRSEKLVASEYNVNIYRARPVMVVDGMKKQKVITAYQTAEQIAKSVGIELYLEDEATISRSDDIVSGGAGLMLTIDRATPVKVDLFGKISTIRTQAATIGDMLTEKGITLSDSDRVRPGLSSSITSNMDIRIWREGKQTVTVSEEVAYDTSTINDADRAVGYKEVKTAGVNGSREVTYEIEIQNGKEVGRKEIVSIVTLQPVDQVEIIGTKILLVSNYSSDQSAIMTAAGVPASDQKYAAYIINNENALWCPIRWQGTNGCGESYYEKFLGAETSNQLGYGLCQSTPAIKMASAGSDWRTNVVTQMKWCQSYALGRYGTWEAAYKFKLARGWW